MLRFRCSDKKTCSDGNAHLENNAQMEMLTWKIMLRQKWSVVKKCSDNDAQLENIAQMRCSDMLRTHLSTNNHCGGGVLLKTNFAATGDEGGRCTSYPHDKCFPGYEILRFILYN